MRGNRPTSSQLSQSASKAKPQRIVFDGRKIKSLAIINTALSDQTLWLGVNTEEVLEPLVPGQSKPLEAEENAYLVGFVTLAWDDPTQASEVRLGISTMTVDIGDIEVKDC